MFVRGREASKKREIYIYIELDRQSTVAKTLTMILTAISYFKYLIVVSYVQTPNCYQLQSFLKIINLSSKMSGNP